MAKKKRKKQINVARILVIILFIYIVVCIGYYIYKEPIRHIEISGNKYLSDDTIIKTLGLKDYPPFISVSPKKMKNMLDVNDFVLSSKVSYGWNFTINIDIKENRPLIKQKSSNGIILSDGSIISDDKSFVGIPILLNDPPKKIIKDLTKSLSVVDPGIIYTISEIEYSPSYNSSNQVIDDERFLLTMIDGNHIYITAKKAHLLNKYLDIAASTYKKGNGTLYLDSNNESYLFTPNKKKEVLTTEATTKKANTNKKKTKKTTKTTKKTEKKETTTNVTTKKGA